MTSSESIQTSFFTDINKEKLDKISKALDKITDKYGKNCVTPGENAVKTVNEKHKRKAGLKADLL